MSNSVPSDSDDSGSSAENAAGDRHDAHDEDVDSESPRSLAVLDDATSVLLTGPRMGASTADTCFELLTRMPLGETQVVQITYHQSPTRLFERYDTAGSSPARLFVIEIDGDSAGLPAATDDVTHRAVGSADLTGLGIEVQRVLDAATRADLETVVCFDSLTALLMYVDERVAFRFVRTIAGYVLRAGASIHFHLDPAAHDSRTVGVFTSAVDALVETDEAGITRIVHR